MYPPAGFPSRSRPAGVVRTPTTCPPRMRSASAGNPVNTFTPSSSARAPSQRTTSQIEATWWPWFRIEGGVGSRILPRSVRSSTRSPATRPRRGSSPSSRSGKSVRKASGFTTAPERQCSPSSPDFSRTPISRSASGPPSARSRAASCASRIAPASPAGPPPTKRTSSGTASGSGSSSTMKRPGGSGGCAEAGISGFTAASRARPPRGAIPAWVRAGALRSCGPRAPSRMSP